MDNSHTFTKTSTMSDQWIEVSEWNGQSVQYHKHPKRLQPGKYTDRNQALP